MKIQVMRGNRPFTYWIDGEVAVGDEVMVPAPFWDPSGPPHRVPVLEVGSDYDGPLTRAWLPPGSVQAGDRIRLRASGTIPSSHATFTEGPPPP